MSSSWSSVRLRWGLTASDPAERPVMFVGQASHLAALAWSDVRCKLRPQVSEETWQRGVECAGASPGEAVEVWPRGAALAALPPRRSRHAPPARPHALAKITRNNQCYDTFVVVCRKRDVLASCVAVARSFPLYSARSPGAALLAGAGSEEGSGGKDVSVEILLVSEDKCDGDSEEEGLGPLDPLLADNALSDEDLAIIQHICDYTRLAASIADQPANVMTIDKFIQTAIDVASSLDIAPPTVIRGEDLATRGLGGIYGVGRGAEHPPALVALTYRPPAAARDAPATALVGKGIVYDTGGLSIKARTAMVGMKGDCAGAAAVLGAFAAAVRAGPCAPLHAVLCLAENSVGPKATRPDDIHRLYSGRSVEINNTDAEGRLVLADGVVFAHKDLGAGTIIDVATLTGAQGIATGKYHAGIVSNNARLEAQCVLAGLVSGEPTHALPFAPELHFSEFSSAVADMKNSVADRGNAQPSCAALFVLAHLGFEFRGAWLHVDMAAPAHEGERATGYGVSLLSVLLGNHLASPILRALSPAPLHSSD